MKRRALRWFHRNGLYALGVVVVWAFFCAWATPRFVPILLPIDASRLSLGGGARAEWNGIRLSEGDGLVLDQRPLTHQVSGGFMLSYDLLIRRLGRIEITAIYPDGARRQIASMSPTDFWNYAGLIVDGVPLKMTIYADAGGDVSLNLESESRVIRPNLGRPPFAVEIVFRDSDILILDARLLDTTGSDSYWDEQGRVLHRIRKMDSANFSKFLGPTLFLAGLAMAFLFRVMGLSVHRRDPASLVALLGGMAWVAASRGVGPGALALVVLVVFLLKVAWYLHFQKREWAAIFLFLATSASAAIFRNWTGTPPALAAFTPACLLLMTLQEVTRARKTLPWSQAASLVLSLGLFFCLEAAARTAFPGGRILRGLSEDLFWSMEPPDHAPLHSNVRGLELQGRYLKDLPARERPAVVLLGGSVIYGSVVNSRMNPAHLLQEALGDSADIFNAGLVGASSFDILESFRRSIAPRRPEIVLAYLLHNDIFQTGPLTKRRLGQRRSRSRKVRGLLGHLVLYRYAAEKVARLKDRAGVGRCSDSDILDSFEQNLQDLAEEVTKGGGHLILVPEEVRLEGDLVSLADALRSRVLAMDRLPGVEVAEVNIPPEDEPGRTNFTDAVHLTESGYRHLARDLGKILKLALSKP